MQRTGDSYPPADDVTLRIEAVVLKVAAPCRCHVPWYPSSHLAPGTWARRAREERAAFWTLAAEQKCAC